MEVLLPMESARQAATRSLSLATRLQASSSVP
ncbi:hypothetical protein IEO21_09076 [Rhodonia placenta]|uniref:Uncharacterized protein n=1 Tax=Rhodonia placenta TaxID=104341 RepID=A0A8H7NV26_9APHY|nr:hypothetical protein IEO21_09076 [Postia placenta]